jgi:hypothetical protein
MQKIEETCTIQRFLIEIPLVVGVTGIELFNENNEVHSVLL